MYGSKLDEFLAQNRESRATANRWYDRWTQAEDETLMLWDRTDEQLGEVAQLIGRTRAACRNRFLSLLRGDCHPAWYDQLVRHGVPLASCDATARRQASHKPKPQLQCCPRCFLIHPTPDCE